MDSNAFSEKMNTIKNNNTINIDPRNKYVPKKWWNEECSSLFKLRNEYRRKSNKSHKFEDIVAYLKVEDEFKKYIKERKFEAKKLENSKN